MSPQTIKWKLTQYHVNFSKDLVESITYAWAKVSLKDMNIGFTRTRNDKNSN